MKGFGYALLGVLFTVGCGGADSGGAWAGSVTEEGGRTIVHNPAEGMWAEGEEWRIEEELRLGVLDGDSPEVFGVITALAVSEAGDIAVLDGQAREVRVFDREGRHLRSFGRAGQGPGEFQGANGLHFDPLGRLWVVDVSAGRYHLFDGEGEYVRSHPRDMAAGVILGNPGVAGRNGFFDPSLSVTPGRFPQTGYMHVDTLGVAMDSVPPVPEVHRTVDDLLPFGLMPFLPRIITALEPGGDVWIASTDSYRIFRRTPAGDTVLEIRVAAEPRGLSAEQEDTISAVIERFSSPVAPPVDRRTVGVGWRHIRALIADDEGRLFVRPMTESFVGADAWFDVFDAEGRYLGRLHWDVEPSNRPPPVFRGGKVYAVAFDEMGAPIVVRGAVVGR